MHCAICHHEFAESPCGQKTPCVEKLCPVRKFTTWTHDEVSLLHQLAGTGLSSWEISKRMGRTQDGVRGKAQSEGIWIGKRHENQNKI